MSAISDAIYGVCVAEAHHLNDAFSFETSTTIHALLLLSDMICSLDTDEILNIPNRFAEKANLDNQSEDKPESRFIAGILLYVFPLYSQHQDMFIKYRDETNAIQHFYSDDSPVSQLACKIYISIAAELLTGSSLKASIQFGYQHCCGPLSRRTYFIGESSKWTRWDDAEAWIAEAPENSCGDEPLLFALKSLYTTQTYADCIEMARSMPGAASIAGGLAGIWYRREGMPSEWIDALPLKDKIDQRCRKLEAYYAKNRLFRLTPSFEALRCTPRSSGLYTTPLGRRPLHRNLEKFRGCLLGGAVGDALGYAIEFDSEASIFKTYGAKGITEFDRINGVAQISDDTQMTLFTGNGLLYADQKDASHGLNVDYVNAVADAYTDWYQTQMGTFPLKKRKNCTWLVNEERLFSWRAPGNTCIGSLRKGKLGRVEDPMNESHGCGGVMRAAPTGLFLGESNLPLLSVDFIGADIAAITHGHELGYLPAAMLTHIVLLLSHNDEITIREAAEDGLLAMQMLFSDGCYLSTFTDIIQNAMELSESDVPDLEAIHRLGEGWVGEEALAIALYCALKYSNDFDKAVVTAVNHKGDSDSTGAIAGNIVGAYLGLSKIPTKFLETLELKDVIYEIADDLYRGPFRGDFSPSEKKKWQKKYVDCRYSTNH